MKFSLAVGRHGTKESELFPRGRNLIGMIHVIRSVRVSRFADRYSPSGHALALLLLLLFLHSSSQTSSAEFHRILDR